MSPPRHARVVIVGGGIVGCSVAYHLTQLGWGDVVLLEQGELAGGTTWHAAGLVGRLRTSNSLTKINRYSAELYASLEAETGVATGWNQVGSLIVARTSDRMIQLRRTAAMARLFGVDAHLVTPAEVRELWPLLRCEDLLGGVWLPDDGKVRPADLTRSLAAAARSRGAQLFEGERVVALQQAGGRVTGVQTTEGEIACDRVVLTGGMWTRALGLEAGVNLPLHPVEHHYVKTGPIEGAHDDLPVGRDPDATIYFRSEGEALVLGAFQARSIPWDVERVPDDFSFQLLEPDWERFAEPLAAGKWRIPALESASFPEFVNGPESFTPDNQFLLGETPELSGCFVAAGFNSVGIASAGGAGRALAEWLEAGEPTMDLWSVDVRRFGPIFNDPPFLRERVAEVLGLHYQMAWPNRELETGRGLRESALHERLQQSGACFMSKNGWERPAWFAPAGTQPKMEYSFGRQNWHAASGAEHRAARESAALFDQSSFSKYELRGPDAAAVLQRVCGAQVDVPPGQVVYTGMFNARGTIESDLTLVRTADDAYFIVTATGQTTRDYDWIRRNTPAGARVELHDVTADRGVLGLMGPSARAILAEVTRDDVSHEGFPFGAARTIEVAGVEVLAVRITYVGELGWELHLGRASMGVVYDALRDAGAAHGLADAGHYAINSLRLEKGYRAWGAELSPDDTPLEAGLSFAIAWDTEFIGREALLAQRERGLTKRMVTFVLEDPEPMLWGSEPILRDGQTVGYTTSGAYGHTLGGAVAMGYVTHDQGVDAAFVQAGRYELEVAGERYAASAHLRSPYDPGRERILR